MTGHGRGTAEREGRRATVEIRSVNHRFLDLKLRGAQIEPAVEDQLSARIRDKVERGAVTVTIHLERRAAAAGLRLDHEAARTVHAALTALASKIGTSPPDLALVIGQPGVVVSDAPDTDATAGEAIVEAALTALARLADMRSTEGATLARDLSTRIDSLVEHLDRIEAAAAAQPEEIRRKLGERLGRLLDESKVALDPARLAQEIAVLADRADVTEEIVRARSHVDQVRALIADQKTAVGRRLDFLVQELGREINTIGSKSSSAEISRSVVEGKAELEKIREQAQNIE